MSPIKWVLPLLLLACAEGPRWDHIIPGMTGQDVMKEMKSGPSKIDPYQDNYSAWFYGADKCVLMQNEKVVSKETTESKGGIRLFGLGGSSESQLAGCVPPGQKKFEHGGGIQRDTATPFGTIQQKQ